MKIFVKARPGSKRAYIRKTDETNFEIAVKEPPIQGKANEAIINSVAGYFKTNRNRVKIISGWSSRQKIIEIF